MRNFEDIKEFDVQETAPTQDGVCAMMRIGHSEEFIVPCLLAVEDFFDEFVIVYNNTDKQTRDLVDAVGLKNLSTYEYPFEIAYRGPDHKETPVDSVHHSAYYYNWCLSKVKSKWVCKWDGDNIALPNFAQTRKLIDSGKHKSILNCAWDLVGAEMNMLGKQPKVAHEARFFIKDVATRYGRNPNGFTQSLCKNDSPATQYEPTFLHLKWCKKNPTMYWPKDWSLSQHFTTIARKHDPVTRYEGPYPQVLLDFIKIKRNSLVLLEMHR